MQRAWVWQAAVWVCALGLAVPEAAFGQATITVDSRKIEALVDCTDAGGTWSWGPTTMTPSALGATFNETLEYNGISPNAEVDADGIAMQSSSPDGSTNFTSLITSGSACAFADVSGLSPNDAQVDVESYF